MTVENNHFLLHLTHWDDWAVARARGDYRVPSLEQEGYIHCSVTRQILRVANTFYSGHTNLLLLVLAPELLSAPIQWEPGADKPDDLFPHIYGPINLDAVSLLLPLPQQNGQFVLSSQLSLLELADWRKCAAMFASQVEGIRIEARLTRGKEIEYRAELPRRPDQRFLWRESQVERFLNEADSVPLGSANSPRAAETLIRDYLAWQFFA